MRIFCDVSVSTYFQICLVDAAAGIVMLMPKMCDGALRIRKQSTCSCIERVCYMWCLASLSRSLSISVLRNLHNNGAENSKNEMHVEWVFDAAITQSKAGRITMTQQTTNWDRRDIDGMSNNNTRTRVLIVCRRARLRRRTRSCQTILAFFPNWWR